MSRKILILAGTIAALVVGTFTADEAEAGRCGRRRGCGSGYAGGCGGCNVGYGGWGRACAPSAGCGTGACGTGGCNTGACGTGGYSAGVWSPCGARGAGYAGSCGYGTNAYCGPNYGTPCSSPAVYNGRYAVANCW